MNGIRNLIRIGVNNFNYLEISIITKINNLKVKIFIMKHHLIKIYNHLIEIYLNLLKEN